MTSGLSWKSRVGGITADAVISDVAKTNPVLKYVETKPGVVRPVIDFGEYCSSTNGVITDGIGAAMNFSARQTTLKEVHQIFADANGSNRQWILGDTAAHDFGRGANGVRYDQGGAYEASSIVRNARTYMDQGNIGNGEAGSGSVVSAGFHNFAFRCWHLDASGWTSWTAKVGAFANGMDVMAGGQQVAESIGFNRLLSDAEFSYLHAYLNWKWLGGARPESAATNAIASVSLANGASLALKSPDELAIFNVASLSGDGTLAADNLEGVSSLAFNVAADGTADCIAVDGSVTFAPPVSVSISFEEGFVPAYGEQTLFSATSAANLSAGSVSVNCPKLHQCAVKVIVTDRSIRLRIAPKGTILSFR